MELISEGKKPCILRSQETFMTLWKLHIKKSEVKSELSAVPFKKGSI